MRFVRILCVLLFTLCFVPTVSAQTGLAMTTQAGFDAYYKDNNWLPLRVSLVNSGAELNGVVRVTTTRQNGSKLDYTYPVALATGARKEVTLYVNVEGFANRVQVDYVQNGTALATNNPRLVQVTANDLLYGVIATNASAFNFLGRVDPANGRARLAQLTVQDLPTAAQAWQALDVLVIADTDTSALSTAQREALKTWIANGGRLILAGGASWQKLSALDDLLPVRVTGTQTLSVQALENFGGTTPLSGVGVVSVGELRGGATVLAAEGAVPLLIEKLYGAGRITFFAVDPSLDPLRTWTGMENVYRGLLSLSSERPGWSLGVRSWASAVEAIGAIPGLGLPHPLLICGFLAAYLVLVGPLNYFVLHLLKRRELAWFTIPLTVVVFTVAIYFTGLSLRGTRPTLHRLSVVQAWEGVPRAQVETIVGLFSPTRAEYDLKVEGDLLLQPLPSDNLFRLERSYDGVQMEQGGAAVARGIKVDVGAVTPFLARGQTAAPQFNSALKYTLVGNQVLLEGTLVNKSDVTLNDAVLLTVGGGMQRLGTFKPNDTANIKIPLAGAQATAITSGPRQVLSSTGKPVSASYASDNTPDQVLDLSGKLEAQELYRRQTFLSWLFTYNSVGRGSGTYVFGWVDKSPITTSLVNRDFSIQDQTLHIWRVQPQVAFNTATVELPPSLLTWEVLDPGSGSNTITPYGGMLYSGYFTLRFKPVMRLEQQKVESLVLHLSSYNAVGATPFTIYLWDYTTNQWAKIDNTVWGDMTITNPAKFVGDEGQIDVKVELLRSQTSANIQSLDFTLTMQR